MGPNKLSMFVPAAKARASGSDLVAMVSSLRAIESMVGDYLHSTLFDQSVNYYLL